MPEGQQEQRILAMFIDFENLAIGFEEKQKGKQKEKKRREEQTAFDVQKVLGRLVEKGNVVVKTAYADWHRFFKHRQSLHEAGIELIEIPRRSRNGKNSADIRLCVDAIDLCYSKEHIDTFVVISGDSDFAPLVAKLKENGKYVIGMGLKESTSSLLSENCDEFIYYEELEQDETTDHRTERNIPRELREVFDLLFSTIRGLIRENHEVLWSSMIKDTIKRKRPSFSESSYGFKSFSELLEDAERRGFITLEKNPRSGTYVVAGFTEKMK